MNAITLKNWLRLCGMLGLFALTASCNALFYEAEVDTDTSGGDGDSDTDSDSDTNWDTDIIVGTCDGLGDCRGSCAPCAISAGGQCENEAIACYGDEYCSTYATCLSNCGYFGAPAEVGVDSALIEPLSCDLCAEVALGDALTLFYAMEVCIVCTACPSDCIDDPIAAECGGGNTDDCDASLDCTECSACAIGPDQACEQDYNNCLTDLDCPQYLNCITTCVDVESCTACNSFASPGAMDLYTTLQTCITCTGCLNSCGSNPYGVSCGGSTTICDAGGGLCEDCQSCVDNNSLCATEITECNNDLDCGALLTCFGDCDNEYAIDTAMDIDGCKSVCVDAHPTGDSLYKAVIQCRYCDSCPVDCVGDPMAATCAIPL